MSASGTQGGHNWQNAAHFAALGLERFVAADELRETEVGDLDVMRRMHCYTDITRSSAHDPHSNRIIRTVYRLHKRLVHCASAPVAAVDCIVVRLVQGLQNAFAFCRRTSVTTDSRRSVVLPHSQPRQSSTAQQTSSPGHTVIRATATALASAVRSLRNERVNCWRPLANEIKL